MIEIPEGTPTHIFKCQNCSELATAVELVSNQTCYFELDSEGWRPYISYLHPNDGDYTGCVMFYEARCSECGEPYGSEQCADLAEHLDLTYVRVEVLAGA